MVLGKKMEKMENRQFLKQLNIVLSDDLAIFLLGIYLREIKIKCLPNHLYLTVHSSIIHDGQRWR